MPRVQSKVTYLENTVLHVVTTLLSFLNYRCLCMQCCTTYPGRARDFFACCVYLTIRRRTKRLIQGGSNMTGTDLCVNKPHCAAAVRP